MNKIDELGILRRLLPDLQMDDSVLVGPGDDTAVLRWTAEKDLLLTVDQLIENVHYTPDTAPEEAGTKLMNRNISDIAAMGGTPLWAVLTVASGSRDSSYIECFCKGASSAGTRFGVPVVGGDLSAMPQAGFAATLTLAGSVPHGKAILRSGAKPGDKLFVTGAIGNSFYSRHHLTFTPRVKEGQFLLGKATAMLDISDGLLLDLARMARASKVDFLLNPQAVPLREGAKLPEALGDGEDYELLFTAPEAPGFACIGEAVPGSGHIFDLQHQEIEIHGYQH